MTIELPTPLLLWNVIEEHFDEASFAMHQFEVALESPVLNLHDLARYPEESLLAHVDALVIAGAEAERNLLLPALAEANDDEPAPAVIAAWVMFESERFDELLAVLKQTPAAWPHAARAVQLTVRDSLEPWLKHQLAQGKYGSDSTVRAGLLELATRRGIAPPNVLDAMQSDDVALVLAATRSVRLVESEMYAPILIDLLRHDDAQVRHAALVAGLSLNLPYAWSACEDWSRLPEQPSPLATQLYAALGGRDHHARLEPLRVQPSARQAVLFALGFTGNADMVPVLLDELGSAEPFEVKLAVQSLALIVGFSPTDDRFALPAPPPPTKPAPLSAPEDDPEAQASLPPLDEDDLEADLVPRPEDGLPEPNIEAIRQHCQARLASLRASKRLLWGEPHTSQRVALVLREGPLRVRHTLATALAIRSGGSSWYDSRGLSSKQLARLAAAEELRPSRFLGW